MLPKVIMISMLVLCTAAFSYLTSAPLKKGPGRMFSLEVAASTTKADAILADWKSQRPADWQSLLMESLQWDTWFICAYAPLCCLLCWLAADYFTPLNPMIGFYSHLLAGAQLFAGCCDFIENAGLRRTITAGAASRPWLQITCTASITKWLLLGLYLLFILAAIFHRLALNRPSSAG